MIYTRFQVQYWQSLISSSRWPRPHQCRRTWMSITYVRVRHDCCFSQCTGLARYQPSRYWSKYCLLGSTDLCRQGLRVSQSLRPWEVLNMFLFFLFRSLQYEYLLSFMWYHHLSSLRYCRFYIQRITYCTYWSCHPLVKLLIFNDNRKKRMYRGTPQFNHSLLYSIYICRVSKTRLRETFIDKCCWTISFSR